MANDVTYIEVHDKDQIVHIPATVVDGRTILATGGLLKIAKLRDEELVEGELIADPESFVAKLKASGLRADILNFPDRMEQPTPRLPYHSEMDNCAVASTTSFDTWWNGLPQESRKNARRAAKRGVTVRVATFDEEFVKGIRGVYDDQPLRQGRRFWHFGKDLETIRDENATYLERSEFIGAYYDGELIGFIKFVYVDHIARLMQIVSKISHFDKRPTNALIAKAMEVCHEKGMAYLVYSSFGFGNKTTSPLAEFKRRNGFVRMDFPRYFVPLTLKGRVALALGLHRGLIGLLPLPVLNLLLSLRSAILRISQPVWARKQSSAPDNQSRDTTAVEDGHG